MEPTQIATIVVGQLRDILEQQMRNRPRTLQTALGPSEIGTACDRCLVHLIAGHPRADDNPDNPIPWLPELGTAVHDAFDQMLTAHMLDRMGAGGPDFGAEWATEEHVTVGLVDGQPVTGSSDVFHKPTGTVIDYKIAGTTTLRKVRRDGSGTSLTYQRQAHLYGRGWAAKGYPVRAVAIWFVPRNGYTLRDGRLWTAAYDEQVAIDALDRATRFTRAVKATPLEVLLQGLPPHTGDEFTCDQWGDSPDTTDPRIGKQLTGIIPA